MKKADDPVNRYVMGQIARHRVQVGIKLADMAFGSCIPTGTISSLLTGRCRCSLINLYRMLAHLGLHITEVWPQPDLERGMPYVSDDILREAIEEAESALPTLVTVEEVVAAAAVVYDLDCDELCSPSRRRDLSEARAVAAYLVREIPHIPLVRLSEELGRHVSSLFHVVKRMEGRLSYDARLRERLEAMRRLLQVGKADSL